MKTTRTPLRIALLPYLLGNDERLVGDLVEEWPRQSHAWVWRQIVFAMLAKAGHRIGSLAPATTAAESLGPLRSFAS